MKQSKHVERKDLYRQADLARWLVLNGETVTSLARRCECSKATISKVSKGQSMSEARIKQLIDLGIPQKLLPKPQPRRATGA